MGMQWLIDLKTNLATVLGFQIGQIECVSAEGKTVDGQAFNFSLRGPFDSVKPPEDVFPPQTDNVPLAPFATEFLPQVPAAEEYLDTDTMWEWLAPKVPALVQPRLNGYRGILEKQGGEAKLWFDGEKAVDQISKFLALKEFVLSKTQDFIADVNVGVERDGRRLPQPEQEAALMGESPQLGENDRLAITMSDLMFLGEDLHEKQASERYAALAKFHGDELAQDSAFRLAPSKEARDKSELIGAAQWARDFDGSEGVAVKVAQSPYVLKGASEDCGYLGKHEAPTVGIYKTMAEKRIAVGVILRPNMLDAQEDVMSPEDVEAAAHFYMENARVVKLRHGKDPVQKDAPLDACVLESYISPADFQLGSGMVKKGDWVMAVRVDDQGVWDKIVSGEYQGFSVGGVGARQDL